MWCAKLPYFLRDSVVLHDTGGATQQSTHYRRATEQRCIVFSLGELLLFFIILYYFLLFSTWYKILAVLNLSRL